MKIYASPTQDSFGWKPIREIKVIKFFQDDAMQEVFKDPIDVYYATTKLPHLNLIVQNILTLEKIRIMTRIRDTFGNHYRNLEWFEF